MLIGLSLALGQARATGGGAPAVTYRITTTAAQRVTSTGALRRTS